MRFPKEFDYHGGIKALAEGLGLNPSTVCGWRRDNKIPRHQRSLVAKLVERERVNETPVEPVKVEAELKLSDIVILMGKYLRAQGM